MGTYSWLPEPGVGLLVETDEAELYQQINQVWIAVFVLCISVLLLALGVSYLLTNWLVTPLEQIAGAARAMQAGDYGVRTQPGGPDEIGQLSAAFNEMADSIQLSHDELEHRVKDRTAQLKDTSEQLRRDIAARVLSEEALRDSEERYRSIFEQAADSIVLVDPKTGALVDFNDIAHENLGYTREEFGKLKIVDFDIAESAAELLKHTEMIIKQGSDHFETRERTKGGEVRDYQISSKVVTIRGEKLIQSMAYDITDRKRAEEQIQASLREKEVLLQEIHHRVKNNLAIISSLLAWQSETIEDKQARAAFQESQNRIRSMARIHEHLYHSPDLAQVGMARYIEELLAYLRESHGSHDVTLTTDAADVVLDLDRALPCGLIINELVSNGLKHAFPAGRTGEIRVAMRPLLSDEGTVELTVSDNGAGLPDHVDIDNTESLGLSVVRLLTLQLHGTLEVDRSEGTTFKVVFQVPDRVGAQEDTQAG